MTCSLVNCYDPYGDIAWWVVGAIVGGIVGGVIGALASAVYTGIAGAGAASGGTIVIGETMKG